MNRPVDLARNVLGGPLQRCGNSPPTGYLRDGLCQTGPDDRASHTVCAQVTDEFLAFSRAQGNDLSTARPEFNFPGLRVGDRWCLSVTRWEEAFLVGVAPPVVLAATHERALDVVELEELKAHAVKVK
jgi:uncharacterized protein (DUF2237 family)